MSSNQVSLESNPHPSWLNVGSRVVGMCFVLSCPCQYVQSVQCYAGHGLSMTELKHLKESLKFVGLRISAHRRRTGTAPFCNLKGVGSFQINYFSLCSKQGMYC